MKLVSSSFSKSVTHSVPFYGAIRRKPQQQLQVNQFVQRRIKTRDRCVDAFQSFLRLAKQQFDVPTIIVAMIYVERLRGVRVFKTDEELAVSAFILADWFINDRHFTKAFMQQNGFLIEGLDDRICQTLALPGLSLFVTADEYNGAKQELDAITDDDE